jgi:hypothetical protein
MGKTTKVGAAFAIGILAGWAASLLMSPEDKAKANKAIKVKAKKLKEILTDKKEQQRIKDIFTKKTAEAERIYGSAKEMVITNLAEIKGQLDDIDTQKYKTAVKNAVAQIDKTHQLPKDQLEKLKEYLESDYKKITTAKKKAPKA